MQPSRRVTSGSLQGLEVGGGDAKRTRLLPRAENDNDGFNQENVHESENALMNVETHTRIWTRKR